MGKEKKKYTSGIATTFISRTSAVKKLQLNLVDFRRLCILKGIYPVQPSDMKKAGRGSKMPKTYFRYKDIQFMANEPILWRFRDHKAHMKKMKRATHKQEFGTLQQLARNKPRYKLDHVVKERYPTFVDALRDIDDPLTLCSLFSIFRKNSKVRSSLIPLCRRLIVEFMAYVIASQTLRKVFLSIKGIYYQAEIEGQKITWLVPYTFGYQVPKDVDLKVMSTFTEFYTMLLGFVNFRLYLSLNLVYPPKMLLSSPPDGSDHNSYCLEDEDISERVAALGNDLAKANTSLNIETIDEEESRTKEDEELIGGADVETEDYKQIQEEENKLKKFKSLFEGCKFFLSREVPREALTFVIRAFQGKVSWNKILFIGATYDETDESITHQIIDRPQAKQQYLSRYYVQPQWVFDCINSRALLPVEDYFPDATLPPHLSPFVNEKEGDYIPPERIAMINRLEGRTASDKTVEDIILEEDDDDDDEFSEDESKLLQAEVRRLQQMDADGEEGESKDYDDNVKTEIKKNKDGKTPQKRKKKKRKSLGVSPGVVERPDVTEEAKREAKQEIQLREMMIPKKKKFLYQKLRKREKARAKKGRKFAARREKFEELQKNKSD